VSTNTTSRPRAFPAAIASNTTAAGSAPARANEIDVGAFGPDFQLLDRGRAERIGRADERRLPVVLDEPCQLADSRGLSGAVDADDHHDVWTLSVRGSISSAFEDLENLFLDELSERRAAPIAILDGRHDALGCRNTNVCRDEHFLERFNCLDIDWPAAPFRCVCLLDDILEAIHELLGRSSKGLLYAIKKTHGFVSI